MAIDNFILFLRKQKCIIPEKFVFNYFTMTKNNFVSLSDCVMWLDVSRDNIVKTLKKSYVENTEYFYVDKEEEINLSKISKNTFNVISNNKKYIKLTTECFKKIAMSSNSKNGRLAKQYYIEMERIVKDFSNQELNRLQNENAKLNEI